MNNDNAPLILVVDDEPLLLMAAADMIEDAGFRVLSAQDADEALALLDANRDVRLVFSDIDMPGTMNGLALVSLIRDRWPPVALVLTSGHVKPTPAEMPAETRFFAKPYNDRRVVDEIRRLAA